MAATYTPAEIAKMWGASERRIRSQARRLGLCCIIGNRMVLTEGDVAQLLESFRPEARRNEKGALK